VQCHPAHHSLLVSSSLSPYGDHRALHSFPTRRSSDLDFPDKEAFFNNFFDKLAGNAGLKAQIRAGQAEAEIRESWEPALSRFKQDRKSTRLNSSHVKISYAVFCLKKKKSKQTRTETRL